MSNQQSSTIDSALINIKSLIQKAKFLDAITEAEQLNTQITSEQHQIEVYYLMAVAQRYSRQYQQALTSLQALLSMAPTHSRAYQEQGYNFLKLDKTPQAQQAFQQAVDLNPCLVASWQELIEFYRTNQQMDLVQHAANQLAKLKKLPPPLLAVTELMHEGKWHKAEQICRHFLQNNKHHIEAMCLLAEIGIELKVYDDAEFLLATALALAPDHLHARSQYMNLMIKVGKFKIAQQQVEHLLTMQADNYSFKAAKANILTGLGNIEQAITLFEEIIAVQPDIADIHLQFGHALKAKGDIALAIQAYQRAYQLNPKYGDAYWSLANTKTYRFSDQEITQMLAQHQQQDITLKDKIQLHFATGKAFEDRKNYQAAFKEYQQGNQLHHQHSAFDISKIEQQVQNQITFCTKDLFKQQQTFGYPATDPIFIVGLPRAGSTLLEQILASHSQVDGTMELHNILGLAARLRGKHQQNTQDQYPQILTSLASDYFYKFGQQFINDTRVYRESAPFFIDKMPNNFLHIGLIKLILPNAKIIDARRAPMACCFSGYKQLFAEGQDFTYDLEVIGRYYQAYIKLMAHWDKVLPDFVLRVHHEDVVEDLESQVRRILAFCGLPFEQACLEFYKTKRTIKTPSSEQVRQPIYKNATEQWRNFEDYLSPLKKVLTDLI